MTGQRHNILFAIMAVQEVEFFAPIAKRLMKEEGLSAAFLTFHEAGDDLLDKEGIPYFSLHKIKRSCNGGNYPAPEKIEKLTGVSMEHLIFHEMHMSGRNREDLISKAAGYYSIFNDILKKNKTGCIVQELGGFIAPLTLYYAARTNNIDHVFIEPAMFRKRVIFTLNSLYADMPDYREKKAEVTEELQQLINEYTTQKTIVIPKKDRHFFRDMTFRRLFSSDNFRRLSRKLYHKYILDREEEYNWISRYISMHIVKAFRRKVLSLYYSHSAQGERYVYYPFHVPLDVQLTARCPEFFEQENLVEKIAQALPSDYKLYIKEHPAAIGGHSLGKLKHVLAACRNVRLLHPGHNSYDIIRNAGCVITVNSKVGFESLIQGKPVVVLGKTFYRGKGITFDVENLTELHQTIKKALSSHKSEISKRDIFLARAFGWSYKGELYENSPANVDNFYASLRSFLQGSGIIHKQEPSLENITP